MQNNTNKNQQLLKDRLFLEKVFLLDIESCSQTNATDLTTTLESQSKLFGNSNVRSGDRDTVSEPVSRRTISPVNFVSIYAIVVTLLLLLPSNSEGANSKTILKDTASHIAVERENERISLLETKIQQLEAKTQTLALEVATSSEQKLLPAVETIRSVALPAQESVTKLEATELDREQSVDNSTQQTTDRLPPLPVPAPPYFVSQTTSPLPLPPTSVRTVTAINTANPNSPAEPEVKPKLEIKSEVIGSETTVEEKIDKPAEQWLGQTDVVYYSFSFQENSTSENLTEPEASSPDDEDLKQYLTTVPRSTKQLVASDRILDSDSQPIAEPTQLLPDVKNNESLAEPKSLGSSSEEDLEQYLDSSPLFDNESELPSTAFDSKKPSLPTLFDDEDLTRYLDAPLLDDELVRQILGTSTSTARNEAAISEEAKADEHLKSTEQPREEKIIRRSLAIEVEGESQARQPLFADEDLRQFLTHTPLFSDSVLKEKLKSKQ